MDLAIIYSANDAVFDSFDGYIIKNIGTRSVRSAFILPQSDKVSIYQALKDMDLSSYRGFSGQHGWTEGVCV